MSKGIPLGSRRVGTGSQAVESGLLINIPVSPCCPTKYIEGEVLLRAGVTSINTNKRYTSNKGERNGIDKRIRINNHQNKNKCVLSFHVTGTAPSALCFNYLNPPPPNNLRRWAV